MAGICIVYLHDYTRHFCKKGSIQECQYFTRGWTLQELLAPRNVDFYDRDWTLHCSKKKYAAVIEERTDIPARVLWQPSIILHISIARSMSWASHGITTRIEDMAYCLLGIFEVGLSLRYGEGEEAFQRLRQAIIERSADELIFAWGDRKDFTAARSFQSLLATSPRLFASCGGIVQIRPPRRDCPPVQRTSQGAKICSNLTPTKIRPPFGNQVVCSQTFLFAHSGSRSLFLDMTIDLDNLRTKKLAACYYLLGRKSAGDTTYWRIPNTFGAVLEAISIILEPFGTSHECRLIYVGMKGALESVIDLTYHTALQQLSCPARPSQTQERAPTKEDVRTAYSLGATQNQSLNTTLSISIARNLPSTLRGCVLASIADTNVTVESIRVGYRSFGDGLTDGIDQSSKPFSARSYMTDAQFPARLM